VLDLNPLIAAVNDVRCVNCGPGWLDYAAAFGAILGVAVAGLALVLTHRSADDARQSREASTRSADAAERTARAAEEDLALFKEEVAVGRAERARRAFPKVDLSAVVMPELSDAAPRAVIIGVHIINHGSRAAKSYTVNLFMPEGIGAEACSSGSRGYGQPVGMISGPTPRDLGRGEEPSRYWTHDGEYLPAKAEKISWGHVKINTAAAGSHPLAVEVVCPDFSGGRRECLWELVVPPLGDEVLIREKDRHAQQLTSQAG
jgi:hypothetical protein